MIYKSQITKTFQKHKRDDMSASKPLGGVGGGVGDGSGGGGSSGDDESLGSLPPRSTVDMKEVEPQLKDYAAAVERAVSIYPVFTEHFWFTACFQYEKVLHLGRGAMCVEYPSFASIGDPKFNKPMPPYKHKGNVCDECGTKLIKSKNSRHANAKLGPVMDCPIVHHIEIEWFPADDFKKLLRRPGDRSGISVAQLQSIYRAINNCDVNKGEYIMVAIAAKGGIVHVRKLKKCLRDDYGLLNSFTNWIYKCDNYNDPELHAPGQGRTKFLDRTTDRKYLCSRCKVFSWCSAECFNKRIGEHMKTCTTRGKAFAEIDSSFRRNYDHDADMAAFVAKHEVELAKSSLTSEEKQAIEREARKEKKMVREDKKANGTYNYDDDDENDDYEDDDNIEEDMDDEDTAAMSEAFMNPRFGLGPDPEPTNMLYPSVVSRADQKQLAEVQGFTLPGRKTRLGKFAKSEPLDDGNNKKKKKKDMLLLKGPKGSSGRQGSQGKIKGSQGKTRARKNNPIGDRQKRKDSLKQQNRTKKTASAKKREQEGDENVRVKVESKSREEHKKLYIRGHPPFAVPKVKTPSTSSVSPETDLSKLIMAPVNTGPIPPPEWAKIGQPLI